MNLQFTSKIRNFLDLFSTSMAVKTCSSQVAVPVPQTMQKKVISRCCYAEDDKEMYKHL